MKPRLLACLVLICLTFAVYANALHGAFVFDDRSVILQNPALMAVHSLHDAFALRDARTLLLVTYGINYYFAGVMPTSYHVTNITIHALNSILVFFLLLRLVESTIANGVPDRLKLWASFSGAAVFAVHTLNSSAVNPVSGRSSVLCATFYFIALLAALSGSGRWLYFNSAVIPVSAYAAWMTKQEAITLPLLIATICLILYPRVWKYMIGLSIIPVLILALNLSTITALYQSVYSNTILANAGFDRALEPSTFLRTYVTAFVGYYLPRMLAPFHLSADPEILPVAHAYSPEFLTSCLILGMLVWTVFHFQRSHPLVSIGIASVLISPLSAYASIPLADVVLEHRAYIATFGIAILMCAFIMESWAVYFPTACIILLSFMTLARNPVWSTDLSLWTDATNRAPYKARTHFNLAEAYATSGNPGAALAEYHTAQILNPNLYAAYSNAAGIYANLGTVQFANHQFTAADQSFAQAESMLMEVTRRLPDFPEGWINLAVTLMRRNALDQSMAALNRALDLNANSFPAHYNIGEIYRLRGEWTMARTAYQTAYRLRPDQPETLAKIKEMETHIHEQTNP